MRQGVIGRLRLAYLTLGMMFFYGIEQVFLNDNFHNPSARGYVTILFTLSLLIFDIPTGVIADRISRKLCMLAACVVQAVSLVILGFSHTLLLYLVGSVCFGLAISLFNGAAQAYFYDYLKERREAKRYPKLQGNNYAAFLLGAGIANVVSGWLAQLVSLRSTYFFSIIPLVATYGLLASMPGQAKSSATASEGSWLSHLHEVSQEIGRHKRILIFGLQFIAAEVLLLTIGEFGQIYFLSFGVGTVLLGIFWSVSALAAALGRNLAHRVQFRPRRLLIWYAASLGVFSLATRSWGIGVFWLVYGLNEAVANVAETEVQNETSSQLRATTFSVISFGANLVAVPVIFMYTRYNTAHGIIAADRLLVIPIALLALGLLAVKPPRIHTIVPDVTAPPKA